MAIISKGILGNFSGKVGSIVGGNWRGISYIRSVPKKVKRVASEKMLNQQAKFKMVMNFVNPLRSFIKKSLADQKLDFMTSANLMTSDLLKYAVVGELPNLKLEFSKIVVSKGKIESLGNLSSIKSEKGIEITWAEESSYLVPIVNAEVKAIIYNESKSLFSQSLSGLRKNAKGEISLKNYSKGDKLAIWIYVSDPDSEAVSGSQFLGQFAI